MEQESDLVAQGKLIGETSYPEKRHELAIDGVNSNCTNVGLKLRDSMQSLIYFSCF